jgi:hypothetical protein
VQTPGGMNRENDTVRVLGFRWSPAEHDVKDYLARSRTPYEWLDVETKERETVPTAALFVYIGAVPPTDWLEGIAARD